MKNNYLFVYGTLMQTSGHAMHHVLKADSKFICQAWIIGKLYQIDDYPGAMLSADSSERVYGELYQLAQPQQILARLDEYEACSTAFPTPHEYERQLINVHISDTKTVKAWTYLYKHSVIGHKRILSGHFNRH